MSRRTKGLLIAVASFIGLYCAYEILQSFYIYHHQFISWDWDLGTLLLPLIGLLSLPSVLFNLRCFNYLNAKGYTSAETVDYEILQNNLSNKSFNISPILWIGNILFGALLLVLVGIAIYSFAADKLRIPDIAVMLTMAGLSVLGISILVDTLKTFKWMKSNNMQG